MTLEEMARYCERTPFDYPAPITVRDLVRLVGIVQAAKVVAQDPESGLKVHALWGALANLE
jgi:hypothetical protein